MNPWGNTRAHAAAYLALGWAPVPRYRGGNGWVRDINVQRWRRQTPPFDLVQQWWPEDDPDRYDVKLMTGRVSKLTVADFDGPCAVDLAHRFVPASAPLASGRYLHAYFTWGGEATSQGDPMPGCVHDPSCRVELKAEGGASDIVAPPSIHAKTGKPYRWVRPPTLDDLPRIPRILVFAATPKVAPPPEVRRTRTPRYAPPSDSPFPAAVERLESMGGCTHVLEAHGHRVVRGKTHCPFHDDRTPSMAVFTSKGGDSWARCFGCGWSDDVVGLEAALSGRRPFDVARDYAGVT